MKRRRRAASVPAALITVAVLGACGTEQAGGGPGSESAGGDVDVAGTRWIPRAVTVDGREQTVPPKSDAYVRFKPGRTKEAGGDSGGSTGCNHLGADVAVAGDTVTVSDVTMTRMACLGDLGTFEERFVQVFRGELRAKLTDEGRGLTLTKDNGDGITFRAAGR